VPIPGEQMTVERCLDGCMAAGYNAAALEAGQVGFLSLSDLSNECMIDCTPIGMLYVPLSCYFLAAPLYLTDPMSDCDLATEPQPPGWESTNSFECADPCLANATEVCGGLIPSFEEPGSSEGRLSAYLICDVLNRCSEVE
jgi:hypothetical protein